jgi:hypothetical protein
MAKRRDREAEPPGELALREAHALAQGTNFLRCRFARWAL